MPRTSGIIILLVAAGLAALSCTKIDYVGDEYRAAAGQKLVALEKGLS
jgi:hypothetical protein